MWPLLTGLSVYLLAVEPTPSTSSDDLVRTLVSQGPLVAFFVLLLMLILSGRLVTGRTHDRVLADKAKAEENLADLQESFRNMVIPSLKDAAHASVENTRVLGQVVVELQVADRGSRPRT